MKNKEQIYDEKISPLVAEIIKVCQENKIAMLASFSVPTENDPHLGCTTALLSKEYEPSDQLVAAFDELGVPSQPPLMTKTLMFERSGKITLTAVLA